jgi:hypothetical protein
MKKSALYFPHDYNAASDEKMAAYLSQVGIEGYGIYWMLIELMHQAPDGKLSKQFLKGIAYQIRADLNTLDRCYATAIECGLFTSDDEKFWSDRVVRNKAELSEYRQKKSEAGRAGMQARYGKASTVITEPNSQITKTNKQNKTKQKESKVKEGGAKAFLPPSIEQVKEYFSENGYTQEAGIKAWKYYHASEWRDRNDKQIKNWKQKMIAVWFKDEHKIPTPTPGKGLVLGMVKALEEREIYRIDPVTGERHREKVMQ